MTAKQIEDLAEAQRLMDKGELPFVINQGMRWAVPSMIMSDLGLQSGQAVSDGEMHAILIVIVEGYNRMNHSASIRKQSQQTT